MKLESHKYFPKSPNLGLLYDLIDKSVVYSQSAATASKGKNIYLAQRDNLYWEILFVQIFFDISFSPLDFDISNLNVFLADGNKSHLCSNSFSQLSKLGLDAILALHFAYRSGIRF